MKQNLSPNESTFTEDVRNYAAEPTISEAEALAKGMAKKSKESTDKGCDLYAKQ